MSQTSESKVAGMWRPIELTDGDIVKLFQSGKHGEANYRQFDGRWYVLDESPEGIAEARQEELIRGLDFFHRQNGDEISRLTADLAKANEEIRELKSELHQVAGDRARDRDWFNDQAATLAKMKEQRDRERLKCLDEVLKGLRSEIDNDRPEVNNKVKAIIAEVESMRSNAIAACETGGQNGKE